MTPFTIRDLVPQSSASELDVLAAAYLEVWNAPDALPYLSFTLRPFEEAQVRAWLSHHLDAGVRYPCALAADGRILGIAVVREDPLTGVEPLGMAVRAEARRGGIGRALLQHVLDVARARGLRAVDIAVFADNVAMLRLALSLGFVPIRLEHRRRADGVDLLHLRATTGAA